MKTNFKNYWVMLNEKGRIIPGTVAETKRFCIYYYCKDTMTYDEAVKSYSLRCVKVNVNFEIL